MSSETAVTPLELMQSLAEFPPPTLVDVRRAEPFKRDLFVIPGAVKRAPVVGEWVRELEPWHPVVVYCVRGHQVARDVATSLRERGFAARHLAGGLEAWRACGGDVVAYAAPTRWVTRDRPKVDRIACPWLVRRFIDPAAEFFYVPASEVEGFAAANGATPFDVAGARYGHHDDRCSFDAFIRIHALSDSALDRLAHIVRGADTGVHSLAAESAGLLATSRGLSRMFGDDHALLRAGMMMYDALYAECRAKVQSARAHAA